MFPPSLSWCASCGYTLAGIASPPEGMFVTAVPLYTNGINPAFPVTVTRIGTSLRRHGDLLYVSPEGTLVPAGAVVSWQHETPNGRHKREAAWNGAAARRESAW